MRPVLLVSSLFLASAAGLGSAAVVEAQTSPKPMTILIYEAGPAWQAGKPPQEQDLGPHFDYVRSQFEQGLVVAFGPQTDAVRGYYVLSTGDAAKAQAFMDNDPGLRMNVLAKVAAFNWSVVIDGFAENRADQHFFLLRYGPGPGWVAGKPLAAQDLGAHLTYIKKQAEAGVVVAAGPNQDADEGLYVVRAADTAAADAFVAADPGVTSGIFKPVVRGWNVMAMQRAR